jgi:hypothetical protein
MLARIASSLLMVLVSAAYAAPIGENQAFRVRAVEGGPCAKFWAAGQVAFRPRKLVDMQYFDFDQPDFEEQCKSKSREFFISQRGWLYLDGKPLGVKHDSSLEVDVLSQAPAVGDILQVYFSEDGKQLRLRSDETKCLALGEGSMVVDECSKAGASALLFQKSE